MTEAQRQELLTRIRRMELHLFGGPVSRGPTRGLLTLREGVKHQMRAIVGDQAAIRAVRLAAAALKKLLSAVVKVPTDEELDALVLVLAVWRPVLPTEAGHALPLSAELDACFPGWLGFCREVDPWIRSVGRIQRRDGPTSEWIEVGTGFVVGEGRLLSNRHVWAALGEKEAAVCFGGEGDFPGKIASLSAGAALPADPSLDLALFRFESDSEPVVELDLEPVASGEAIAVIGFPMEDDRSLTGQAAIFGELPEKLGLKRVAPGELISVAPGRLGHDASTLGGCSGAPVFRQATGRVLGVHFEGEALRGNGAIPAGRVREFLESQ